MSVSSFSSTWTAGNDGRMHEQVHQEHTETILQGSSVQQMQSRIDCTDGRCTKTLVVNEQQPQHVRKTVGMPEVIVVTNSLQRERVPARLVQYLRGVVGYPCGLAGGKPAEKVSPSSGVLSATVQPDAWKPAQLVLLLATVPSAVGALALIALWSIKCCVSAGPEPEQPLRVLGEPLVPADNAGADLEVAQTTAMPSGSGVEPSPEKGVAGTTAVRTYLLSVFESAETKVLARATRAYVKTLYARA